VWHNRGKANHAGKKIERCLNGEFCFTSGSISDILIVLFFFGAFLIFVISFLRKTYFMSISMKLTGGLAR